MIGPDLSSEALLPPHPEVGKGLPNPRHGCLIPTSTERPKFRWPSLEGRDWYSIETDKDGFIQDGAASPSGKDVRGAGGSIVVVGA